MTVDMSLVRRQFEADAPSVAPYLDRAIHASWQRCASHHLPMTGAAEYHFMERPQLQDLLEQQQPLLQRSRAHLDALHRAIAPAGWSILLTDANSTSLQSLRSEQLSERRIQEAFRPGALLREDLIGTSAMSCAMHDRRFVAVFGEEHYRDFHTNFHCAAVPLFDPVGDVIGAIDITSQRPHRDLVAFSLLEECAANIQLQMMQDLADTLVLELQSGLGEQATRHRMILAIGLDQRILGGNPVAVHYLGLRLQQPLQFNDCFATPFSAVLETLQEPDRPVTLHLHSGIRLLAQRIPAPTESSRRLGGQSVPARPEPARAGQVTIDTGFGDQRINASLEQAARVIGRLPILLLGESGTGKDVAARTLHRHSPAANGPLVTLNCAAIPESLIESELFGYERGAFTGARSGGQSGKIAEADGGTLFLDEIGDMPIELQTRLLRVLETREVTRLGSHRSQAVQFQLICATHQDLPQLISLGRFRADLYYRIKGLSLTLPALRERDQVLTLANQLLTLIAAEQGDAAPRSLSPELGRFIAGHPWPGNVRQLRHALIYADALALPHTPLTLADLPAESGSVSSHMRLPLAAVSTAVVATPLTTPLITPTTTPMDFQSQQDLAIDQALLQANGNVSQAARALGIARSTIYRRQQRRQA